MNKTFQEMVKEYKKAIDRYFDGLKPPEDAIVLLHMVRVMEAISTNPESAKKIAICEFVRMPTIINITMLAQFTQQLLNRVGETIDETEPPPKNPWEGIGPAKNPWEGIDPSLN
jgi:hypothetical protein